MPKLVDHGRRRDELARAVWDVISREGIEGATVRRVAEQAGVSVGGLRHYFDSQRGLLRFAAQAVADSVGARVAEHLRHDLPGPWRARRLLEEFLPLDTQRRLEVDVWLACVAHLRADDSMADLCRTAWDDERHLCRLAVADCSDARPPEGIGDVLRDARLERRAARLHAFMDGLTAQAATYPDELPPARARRLLRDEIELIRAMSLADR